MLQVKADPQVENAKCKMVDLVETDLKESKTCLPAGLQELHLLAVRRHAALLSADGSKKHESTADGSTASLDAAGFKEVTSLCCPPEMETFFTRLLESRGLAVCSKPHIQGLMHWFACVPDMDFQYILDVIDNGNPCKYWALIGATCPALSAQCQGKWCR